MANFALTQSFTGLGTFTVATVPTTDNYIIEGSLQLPSQSEGAVANSQVVTLIKKNGSIIYTGAAGDAGFRKSAALTANDAITIVTSSSLAQDNVINAVQLTVRLWEGVS